MDQPSGAEPGPIALTRTNTDAPGIAISTTVWLCALLTGAARFAPLPLLDDFIIGRIERHLVTQSLKAAGRGFDRRLVSPLYEDPQGCVAGCLALLLELPLAILLFPIRKLWGILKAVRGFSKDVARTLLLARSIQRALARGLMADSSPPEQLKAEALAARLAHAQTTQNTDLELLRSTLGGLLTKSGVPRLAERLLRRVRRQDREVESPEDLLGQEPELQEQVAELDQAMQKPQLVEFFAAFDQRFDAALAAKLEGISSAPS